MIRLYLDSNIFTKLKNGSFPELEDLLQSRPNSFVLPYSEAHVQDKKSSADVALDKFEEDLILLDKYSKRHLLHFKKEQDCIFPYYATTSEMYDTIKLNDEVWDDFSDIEGFFKSLIEDYEDLDESGVIKKFKEVLNKQIPKADGSGEYESFSDILQNGADHIKEIRNNPTKYKELRETVRREFRLTPNFGNWREDIIKKINGELDGSKIGNSIHEIITKNKKLEDFNQYDYFLTYFQTLDLIGYQSEKIRDKQNKKKGVLNHQCDAMHAYYAGACDYFVTDDTKLYPKAKAMYEEFNVRTVVCSSKEILDHLKPKLIGSNYELIREIIRENKPTDTQIEDGIGKSMYRINGFFLDYFTHFQLESDPKTKVEKLMFTKLNLNYSDFIWYSERDNICKNVLNHLGYSDDVFDEYKKIFESKDTLYQEQIVANNGEQIWTLWYTGPQIIFTIIFLPENKD